MKQYLVNKDEIIKSLQEELINFDREYIADTILKSKQPIELIAEGEMK